MLNFIRVRTSYELCFYDKQNLDMPLDMYILLKSFLTKFAKESQRHKKNNNKKKIKNTNDKKNDNMCDVSTSLIFFQTYINSFF